MNSALATLKTFLESFIPDFEIILSPLILSKDLPENASDRVLITLFGISEDKQIKNLPNYYSKNIYSNPTSLIYEIIISAPNVSYEKSIDIIEKIWLKIAENNKLKGDENDYFMVFKPLDFDQKLKLFAGAGEIFPCIFLELKILN